MDKRENKKRRQDFDNNEDEEGIFPSFNGDLFENMINPISEIRVELNMPSTNITPLMNLDPNNLELINNTGMYRNNSNTSFENMFNNNQYQDNNNNLNNQYQDNNNINNNNNTIEDILGMNHTFYLNNSNNGINNGNGNYFDNILLKQEMTESSDNLIFSRELKLGDTEEYKEKDEKELIIRNHNTLQKIEENMENLKRSLEMNNPNKELAINLRNTLSVSEKELRTKLKDTILTWPAIHKINCLVLRANYLKQQLSIYENELSQIFENKVIVKPQEFVSIAFVSQPYPQIFKHNTKKIIKKGQTKIVAKILSGAITRFLAPNEISGTISMVISSGKKKNDTVEIKLVKESIENNELYYEIAFPKGTNVSVATFSISIEGEIELPRGQRMKITASSHNAAPFIVATNENQWPKAQKTMLSYSLFGDIKSTKSHPVSFQRFCNFFLPFYMESTRQHNAKDYYIKMLSNNEIIDHDNTFASLLKRQIYDIERRFFKTDKFQNKKEIKVPDFENFWNWCGLILKNLRHNEVIRKYFMEGLIMGFLSKEDCFEVLSKEKNCSFILRYSSSSISGELALANKDLQGETNHSILEPKNIPPLGNLADFLKVQPFLKTTVKTTDGINFQTVNKDDVYQKYYSPDQEVKEGYKDIKDISKIPI
eukprot:TRINITY_DN937_c0_g1_i1.p1 TRINITY_DN937_c0_g1~~TRINITY_DN937_c0_g1_i1.p1  ORF type:complete len:655 (-),score=183.45 TRINITY_DN937_c0_g1_i1:27-1991(-)